MSNTKNLVTIYEQYGPKSREFYNQVEKFIYHILNKHYQNFAKQEDAEDIVQGCFTKMYKALSYFDPNKGNLATFIYTAVRNFISTDLKDKADRASLNLVYDYDLENIATIQSLVVEDAIFVTNILKSTKIIRYSDLFIKDLIDQKIYSEPITRLIAWKKLNQQ